MAKKKKSKLPKKIMGFKIPKQYRSGAFAAALASPVGIALISEVIYHVGSAASRRAGGSGAGRRAEHGIRDAGAQFADAAGDTTSALGRAVSDATHAFLDALRDYRDHHDDGRTRSGKKARSDDADRSVH